MPHYGHREATILPIQQAHNGRRFLFNFNDFQAAFPANNLHWHAKQAENNAIFTPVLQNTNNLTNKWITDKNIRDSFIREIKKNLCG